MKHLPSLTCLALAAGLSLAALEPAAAQVPSATASFTGESIITTPEGTMSARLYGVPGKIRTDSFVQGMSTVAVMDLHARKVLTWSPDPSSGMGTTAMKMDYGKVADRYGAQIEAGASAERVGQDSVAGHSCTVYRQDDMTACVTYDGIVLRTRSREGYGSEMRSMTRGPQPSSYFQVPAGYSVMDPTDFGSMMGSQSGRDSSSGDIYSGNRETSGRTTDEEDVGRAVGDIIGGDAGKLVGGLFGKKKKKKR